jgi:hypothetical protein
MFQKSDSISTSTKSAFLREPGSRLPVSGLGLAQSIERTVLKDNIGPCGTIFRSEFKVGIFFGEGLLPLANRSVRNSQVAMGYSV